MLMIIALRVMLSAIGFLPVCSYKRLKSFNLIFQIKFSRRLMLALKRKRGIQRCSSKAVKVVRQVNGHTVFGFIPSLHRYDLKCIKVYVENENIYNNTNNSLLSKNHTNRNQITINSFTSIRLNHLILSRFLKAPVYQSSIYFKPLILIL